MDTMELLSGLIRLAVCGSEATKEITEACTPEALEQVCALALKHDLAHLAGQGASKLSLPESEPLNRCKKAAMQAFFRYTQQEMACQKVCDLLEMAEIPFIPLKGTVLRQYYPEGWMRTSCDMDILVREETLEQASALLQEKGWQFRERSPHDLAFMSAEGVHLELHFTAIEDFISLESKSIMDGIWQDAKPVEGKQYRLEISDELFYFYHMVHMAKHLIHGGCGIRTFLDVWILNHRVPGNTEKRQALLEKGKCLQFARAAETLSEIWFSGKPMDTMSRNLEQFILSGGTYGSLQNRVSLQQSQQGGKVRYALKRIFLPYDIMKHYYPVLQKHKILLPFCHIARWLRLIFGGGMKRSVRELQVNAEVSDATGTEAKKLVDYLGL